MKDVRIIPGQPISTVGILCECGNSAMTNLQIGLKAFMHEMRLCDTESVPLSCECGKKFRIRPQKNHFHVTEE